MSNFFWRIVTKTALLIGYEYGFLKGYVFGALGWGGNIEELEESAKIYRNFAKRLDERLNKEE